MSKAVLVIDMPKGCMDCKLKSTLKISLADVTHCCNLACGTINLKDGWDKRLDNCPLVPMPERKQNACSHGFAGGWNAAIDAIGGK